MTTINAEIREKVYELGCNDTLVFDNPDFDEAIIGVTYDGQAVYDYWKMVESLMAKDNMTEEDALDFIHYNTLRSLPYAGSFAPIVMLSLED